MVHIVTEPSIGLEFTIEHCFRYFCSSQLLWAKFLAAAADLADLHEQHGGHRALHREGGAQAQCRVDDKRWGCPVYRPQALQDP